MTRLLTSYRLLPIVLLAAGALFVLKSTGIILEGGYTLGERMALRETQTMTVTIPASPARTLPSSSQPLKIAGAEPDRSWMQEIFNYPDRSAPDRSAKAQTSHAPRSERPAPEVQALPALEPIVTGSIGGGAAKEKAGSTGQIETVQAKGEAEAEAKPQPIDPSPADGRVIRLDPKGLPSASERALLERLQERRQELEARGRELDMRETMIQAAEKRLKATLSEVKATEERIAASVQQREQQGNERLKSVVKMYETMKPRDAAKIFDRLDPRVLLEVAGQISPRRMSDIMAQMNPETAEKLTVDLATRAKGRAWQEDPASLPKIQGRPTGG